MTTNTPGDENPKRDPDDLSDIFKDTSVPGEHTHPPEIQELISKLKSIFGQDADIEAKHVSKEELGKILQGAQPPGLSATGCNCGEKHNECDLMQFQVMKAIDMMGETLNVLRMVNVLSQEQTSLGVQGILYGLLRCAAKTQALIRENVNIPETRRTEVLTEASRIFAEDSARYNEQAKAYYTQGKS